VALALILGEPSSERAARLIRLLALEPAGAVTPTLFDCECAGGLVKAVRRGRLDAERAMAAMIRVLQIPVERKTSPAAALYALELALDYGISGYDAVYVALAAEGRLPLVTADARLVRALDGSPHQVILLDDVEL
jgi:predicted nucleic acid-binding protein